MVNDQTFELEAAISISPTTGSVGDSIQIQMTDFPSGASVSSVTIAKVMVPGASFSADPRGNGSFSITIPNDVPQGVERLELKTGTVDVDEVKANTKIDHCRPGYSGYAFQRHRQPAGQPGRLRLYPGLPHLLR